MNKYLLSIITTIFCIALMNCEQDVGIFASLQREVKVTDANLANTLTVPMMAVVSATDIYATTPKLYHKDVSGNWNAVSLNVTGYNICSSIAVGSGTLYVILSNSSTAVSAVYTFNGSVFSHVYTQAAGEQLGPLFTMNNLAYYSVRNSSGIYQLYQNTTPYASNLTEAPKKGALLSGTYYVIAGESLYVDTDLVNMPKLPKATYKDSDAVNSRFNDVHSDGSNVFIMASDGDLFCYNGSSWLDKVTVKSGSAGIPLNCAASFVFGTDRVLMIGTDNYGYYEFQYTPGTITTIPAPSSPTAAELSTDYSNFNASDLKKCSILSMVIDASGSNAYAGTANNGVWLNTGLIGSSIWNHE